VCNPAQPTPFLVSAIIPDEPKKSVNIAAIIGFLIFLVILGFAIFNLLEVFPLPLPEENLPDVVYGVDKCMVEGSDANRVACFKSEMRQVGETWLTQFQADDGEFIQSQFPSFNGLEFLLVCIPKETGPAWAESYGEKFFIAIGSQPINDETGKEDASTITEGFWLFPNPQKFRQDPLPQPAPPPPPDDSAPAPGETPVPAPTETPVPPPATTPTPPPTTTPIPMTQAETIAIANLGKWLTDQGVSQLSADCPPPPLQGQIMTHQGVIVNMGQDSLAGIRYEQEYCQQESGGLFFLTVKPINRECIHYLGGLNGIDVFVCPLVPIPTSTPNPDPLHR